MKIGAYDVRPVMAGEFALDGGAMFGIVPQPLWAREHPPDEKNRIDLAVRSLLIRGEGRTIICDTGVGRKWDDKHTAIYKVRHDRHELVRNLAALGIAPEDVTDVVISHLHFDHAGGATVREGDAVRPTFPRARVHVQEENWQAATDVHELEKRSYLPENFLPIQAAGLLELHAGGDEIAPGVELIPSQGHTPGMHCTRVFGNGDSILFCADLMPTASHVRVPYIMGYDRRPDTIIEEKRKILARAVDESWILFFYHDPKIAAARAERDGDGFKLGAIVEFESEDAI